MRIAGTAPFLAVVLAGMALYVCVLPLWEGWDEPYHYSYVQTLETEHHFPVLGQSKLSAEVTRSLTLTPVSRFAAELGPGRIAFEHWHLLPQSDRLALRSQLQALLPSARIATGTLENYEAQQTPLAYLVLAPVDLLFSHVQIVPRILILRGVEALGSVLLIYLLLIRLSRTLQIGSLYRQALLLCALSVQTLAATVAHVGNDAPAVVLTLWFLTLLVEGSSLIWLGLALGLGLLTKAYFLIFVPVFLLYCARGLQQKTTALKQAGLGVLLPALVSIPWYARNQLLYGSFSGTQETVHGVTFHSALSAVPQIRWDLGALQFLRQSLWCGNWSFTSYSKDVVTGALLLMLLALALYASGWRRIREGERWFWVSAASFVTGLAYQTCVTWVSSQGKATSPEPWYWQGVVLGIWTMLFAGMARWSSFWTRLLAASLTAVMVWMAATTYLVKLLPYYGSGLNRATLPAVVAWWKAHPSLDLQTTLLAPVAVVFSLLAVYLLLLVIATVIVVQQAVSFGRASTQANGHSR